MPGPISREKLVTALMRGDTLAQAAVESGHTHDSVRRMAARIGAKRAAMGTLRPCMCCRRSFVSEGKFNRLCRECAHQGDPFGRQG